VVYKTEVPTALKGVRPGQKFHFGPFVSYGVGSEYLIFLQWSKDEAVG
jgi:hypothetical protein